MPQEKSVIQIVVLIKIKSLEKFGDYENKAISIMAEYSGNLISAFRPNEIESTDTEANEVHILEFPSIEKFNAYRVSSKIKSLVNLRDQAIEKTTVYLSNEFINYN
jgi:uncharacterized protein (DUF1330 family)